MRTFSTNQCSYEGTPCSIRAYFWHLHVTIRSSGEECQLYGIKNGRTSDGGIARPPWSPFEVLMVAYRRWLLKRGQLDQEGQHCKSLACGNKPNFTLSVLWFLEATYTCQYFFSQMHEIFACTLIEFSKISPDQQLPNITEDSQRRSDYIQKTSRKNIV